VNGRSQRCPNCSQTLLKGDGKCPDCFGTGTNVSLVSDDPKCPKCQGTGICQRCGGHGLVIIKPEEALERIIRRLERKLEDWNP